jgi:hypothetical protein
LTRQLLSFSRKQFLNPTVMDLNETVTGLQHMLPRVIGEHIRTTIELSRELMRVRADASQMDQVLVNLVLNARDAMPSGGQLTITTENVFLDEERIDAEGTRACCRFLRDARSQRYGMWHGRRDAGARVRAVLHHETERQGHRARPCDCLRHR